VKIHPHTRLRHSSGFSMLSARSLDVRLLRMYTAKRRTCRTEVVETTGVFGKGRRSDKEARSENPSAHVPQTMFSLLHAR